MEKALGFRLMDKIKEVMELENVESEVSCALFLRNVDEKINFGIENIEKNLKAQASVYGVKLKKYEKRIEAIKSNYISEIEKIRGEYEFQFVNLQLELRENLANQKLALLNAKKILDQKLEFIKSEKYKKYIDTKNELIEKINKSKNKSDYDKYYEMLENILDPTELFDQKKEMALNKYYNYSSVIRICEDKIEECIKNTIQEIDTITNENIERFLLVVKESTIVKIVNKFLNIFSGKSKFEDKLEQVENNISNLSISCKEKIFIIKNTTIKMVTEIQEEKDLLNSEVA